MRFGVQPIVKEIVDERWERFGAPSSELTARFDLLFCAAAAWVRGRFTLDEMREPAYTDPTILALRERAELVPDPARESFDGCSLEIEFTDGSTESTVVDAFLGSPDRRMTDDQLSELFRASAGDLLPAGRAEAVLEATWGVDAAPDARGLMSLATLA
jgi:2-methylcitrate dehydratase PrpD